jgi:hypothetical protein
VGSAHVGITGDLLSVWPKVLNKEIIMRYYEIGIIFKGWSVLL